VARLGKGKMGMDAHLTTLCLVPLIFTLKINKLSYLNLSIAAFTRMEPICIAFDKFRQRLPELVEGNTKMGTTQMNTAISQDFLQQYFK
jgi:hypothetical protein